MKDATHSCCTYSFTISNFESKLTDKLVVLFAAYFRQKLSAGPEGSLTVLTTMESFQHASDIQYNASEWKIRNKSGCTIFVKFTISNSYVRSNPEWNCFFIWLNFFHFSSPAPNIRASIDRLYVCIFFNSHSILCGLFLLLFFVCYLVVLFFHSPIMIR